jgi:flagellar M-ring protein FliF
VGNLIANLRTLSNGRLITLMGAGAAILLALVYLTMKMAAPPLVPLYTGIESEAAGTVLQRLDTMGVTYQVQGESTILVPADQAARLRMTLAADGLPSGGPVGYELLDNEQGLGVTRFQEDIRYLRALEGELARSIRTLNSIANARVHLVLPKREPFQRQAPQPTASVLVVMRGAATLGREQVMAIQYLVAQAVPSLKPQSVSIIDQQGTLLAGSTDDGQGQSAAQAADARAALESRLSHSIEEMLIPHLGPDKVRVTVSADVDYDRVVEKRRFSIPTARSCARPRAVRRPTAPPTRTAPTPSASPRISRSNPRRPAAPAAARATTPLTRTRPSTTRSLRRPWRPCARAAPSRSFRSPSSSTAAPRPMPMGNRSTSRASLKSWPRSTAP